MNIEYPTNEQIKKSVENICNEGIKKRDTVFSFIKNMTLNLGFKNIFYGVYDVMLIAVLITGAVYSIFYLYIDSLPGAEEKIYLFSFTFAPFMFSFLFFLNFAKEKSSDTFIIKMTCKYSFVYLLAYRMFVFSLLSVAANTVYILVLFADYKISFVTVISLSLSSMFIYSLLLIFLLIKFSSVKPVIALSVLWVAADILLYVYSGDLLMGILKSVPLFVWMIIVVCASILYFNALPKLISKRRKEYAYS